MRSMSTRIVLTTDEGKTRVARVSDKNCELRLNLTTKDSFVVSHFVGLKAARPEGTLSSSKGKSKDIGRA